jgi:hypothetical protein
MREWQSQSHVRWSCKYHIVIVPKYRKKAIYGALRKDIGGILKDLCQQFGVEYNTPANSDKKSKQAYSQLVIICKKWEF